MSAEQREQRGDRGGPSGPPTDAELAAIDAALKQLAPIEPPARTLARTQAALVKARAGRPRRVMIGRVVVALATVLASVGVAVLGRGGSESGEGTEDQTIARGIAPRTPAVSGPIHVVEQRARTTREGGEEGRFADESKSKTGGRQAPLELEQGAFGQGATGDLGGQPGLAPLGPLGAKGQEATLTLRGELDGKDTGTDVPPVAGTGRTTVATQEETGKSEKEEKPKEGEGHGHADLGYWNGVAAGDGWGTTTTPSNTASTTSTGVEKVPAGKLDAKSQIASATLVADPTPDQGLLDWQAKANTQPLVVADGRGKNGGDDEHEGTFEFRSALEVTKGTPAKGGKDGDKEAKKEPSNGDALHRAELANKAAFLPLGTPGSATPDMDSDGVPDVEDVDTAEIPKVTVVADEEVAPTFIPASGYFANTYVPGDPEVAFLRHAVGQGIDAGGRRIAADELAKPVTQPFDAPRDQALGLQLSADRTAVTGPTRMLLQVGLSGAAQAPSRRAPLAVAMVVDLGSIGGGEAGADADRRALWGIAQAFVSERKEGDRMSLVVPVPGGAEVLDGAALTTTDVARFLASALERTRNGPVALAPAVERAYAEVHAGMAADAALGANVVVLATAKTNALPRELAERAHREALANVQLALIATARDAAAGDDQSAALVAAGQGRRWVVGRPEEAARAVAQELGAAGRAVARAVRLRIRLAPGVKLVAVLGSHPLELPETTRVREAERAIDRKVAATTGIREDRGADEDGIQIVIPAFMASDDHPILLDVVVPGPGPVLDVRARFKDLVRMQNGEAQASLALESGASQATRLTLNVVENHAAFVAASALRDAAQTLAASGPEAAATRLETARNELARLAALAPSARLVGPRTLVDTYRELLTTRVASWRRDPTETTQVAQSMRLAAAIQAGAR